MNSNLFGAPWWQCESLEAPEYYDEPDELDIDAFIDANLQKYYPLSFIKKTFDEKFAETNDYDLSSEHVFFEVYNDVNENIYNDLSEDADYIEEYHNNILSEVDIEKKINDYVDLCLNKLEL